MLVKLCQSKANRKKAGVESWGTGKIEFKQKSIRQDKEDTL